MFSELKEDLNVNYSLISKMVIAHYRLGNYAYRKDYKSLILLYKMLKGAIKAISNSDIHPTAQIGERFRLEHDGIGVVIHSTAVIGNDCRMFHQATIGINDFKSEQAASIGDNIMIGTGTKIIGDLEIGNNVKIGANAVVTKNVPDNSVAVGIPAQIVEPELVA